MDDEILALIPRLHEYLHRGATPDGLVALFSQHGLRVISEDEGDFLDWCEVQDFLATPALGGVH